MILEIRIPSPGESVTEVELANWLVDNGDFVEKDQEIAEIESDKATLPLIAEESGVINIKINNGETVKVGDVVCEIDVQKMRDNKKMDETKKQYLSETEIKDKTKHEETLLKTNQKKELSKKEVVETNKIKITPLAEKMMIKYNLNIDDILNGLKRITSKEVQAVVTDQFEKSSIKKQTGTRNEKRQTISKLRKKLSERLVVVKNETAMLTTFNEVNMYEIIELRKKYQKIFTEKHGVKLGFMSFFVKAVVESLKLFPQVNSRFENDEIVSPQYYDIGIAVQTDKGLIVPVLRNAELMNLADIEHKIADLAQKAKNNRISIEEMTGGSFSITNGGVFGSLLSTPIINPPQSAILGMHNIVERPIAHNGKVEIQPMMYIALSYDHRMIDGKDSVSFLLKVKELIESPYKMLFKGKNPEEILLDL